MTFQQHQAEDVSLKTGARGEKRENPIPPWERIAVDAATAAHMLSCGRSTFFKRVKSGVYPRPAVDGLWRVSELRLACQANPHTTA